MNRAEIEAAILYAAADLPEDKRREYLGQVCDDDTLRREVEELLAALEKADSFLEPPPSRLERIIATATVGEKAGDRIGHYKLLQQIGEGGCGVVYIAEQEQPIQREVALKILKPGMDTKQVIVRFEAERQALAMMDHPNIARVFDAGATESGRPYFVMELARGSSITRYCDEQQLTIRERLELFVTICDAIQHAHQKGIIHRDIKPSNILITSNNGAAAPKVIDFGIAKATQGRLTDQTLFTAYEQFIGTPAYMSPEQAGMTGLDIDTRSDIYSLGVLLYELLTGRTPFDPKSLAESGIDGIRRTICDEEPPKPSTRLGLLAALEQTATASRRRMEPPKLIQSLKGDLDWIVMKALEKDRSHRYQTASGLGADVVRYLNNEPVTARPPSTLYRVQKLVQRNRLAVAAGVAVSAALILALAILGASNVRIRREQTRKDAALSAANASERRAKDELFTSLRSQARALRSSRQMGQRLGSLAALREAAKIKPDPGLRKEVIAALALPDIRLGPLFRLSRTNCAALTCDGVRQRYAAVLQDGTITVSALDNNREIYRFQTTRNGSERFTTIKFSADGKFLVKAGDDQRPQVWWMHSGEEIRLNAPMGAAAPSFASDGRTLALSSGSNIVCYDLSTGVEKIRWKTHGRIHSIEFNPSEPQIAIGYKKSAIVSIYHAVDGSEVAKLDIGEAERTVTAWHPNSRQLAVGNSEAGIQIWDAKGRRQLAIFSDQVREVDYLTFHPSGNWLASWSWDGSLRVWDPTTRRVAMQALLEAKLQFSLDGRWLGFHWLRDDAVQLIEFVAPSEYITLQKENPAGAVEYLSCAVNSDDRLLATASNTGVEVWDLKSRRQVRLAPSRHTASVEFGSNALWTTGPEDGLQRWPMHITPSEVRFDPPSRVELPFHPFRMAVDRDFKFMAFVSESAGRIAAVNLPKNSPTIFDRQSPLASFVAMSFDAKWIATGGWHTDRCQLWNRSAGELAHDWVTGAPTRVKFTPDGRELILSRGSDFTFFNPDTKERTRIFNRELGVWPGDVAFSADGKLMAMEMAPATIHIKEVLTGKTIAQLEDPFGDRSNALQFSNDGTKLIMGSAYPAAIHIWDLPSLKEGLNSAGLDWDGRAPIPSLPEPK